MNTNTSLFEAVNRLKAWVARSHGDPEPLAIPAVVSDVALLVGATEQSRMAAHHAFEVAHLLANCDVLCNCTAEQLVDDVKKLSPWISDTIATITLDSADTQINSEWLLVSGFVPTMTLGRYEAPLPNGFSVVVDLETVKIGVTRNQSHVIVLGKVSTRLDVLSIMAAFSRLRL